MTGRGWYTSALIPCVLIIAAGAAAYSNTFAVPFVFDDIDAIVHNESIREMWQLHRVLSPGPDATVSGRPVANLSLAVNYALGGLNVRGYHVFNLTIHVLAALVLFGIVRRTLGGEALRERLGEAATPLALVVALIWLVHPLQTESVTYVIQRVESLMGLFYLLTLYCAIRAFTSNGGGWSVGAVAFCALGMGTKEVMVSAPLMVLLYDRVFMSASFRETLKRRWKLYLGLFATWVILASLVATGARTLSTGFHLEGLTPLDYGMTQCRAIVHHYLQLSVWPHPLVFDYGRSFVQSFGEAAVPLTVLLVLLSAVVAGLRYRPPLGFVGAWFFVVLAPSSSLLPIADPIFEHRMYLPLAAVVVLVVLGGHGVLISFLRGRKLRRAVGCGLAAVAVAGLGYLTYDRNEDYRSALSIWQDTVAKVPLNWRPRLSLGVALVGAGRDEEAAAQYRKALRLSPGQPRVCNNLGVILTRQGRLAEAISLFEEALRSAPKDVEAHSNLGAALTLQGKLPESIAQFQQVLRLAPRHVGARNNLGAALARQGRVSEALVHYSEALRVDPGNRTTRRNIFRLLARPRDAGDALKRYRTALRLGIDEPYVLNGLARLLATCPDREIRNGPEAVRLAKRACELTGYKSPRTLDTLAAAHAETGNFAEAVRVAENALEIALGSGQDRMVAVIRGHLALYRSQRPCREGPDAAKTSHPEGMR